MWEWFRGYHQWEQLVCGRWRESQEEIRFHHHWRAKLWQKIDWNQKKKSKRNSIKRGKRNLSKLAHRVQKAKTSKWRFKGRKWKAQISNSKVRQNGRNKTANFYDGKETRVLGISTHTNQEERAKGEKSPKQYTFLWRNEELREDEDQLDQRKKNHLQ